MIIEIDDFLNKINYFINHILINYFPIQIVIDSYLILEGRAILYNKKLKYLIFYFIPFVFIFSSIIYFIYFILSPVNYLNISF